MDFYVEFEDNRGGPRMSSPCSLVQNYLNYLKTELTVSNKRFYAKFIYSDRRSAYLFEGQVWKNVQD